MKLLKKKTVPISLEQEETKKAPAKSEKPSKVDRRDTPKLPPDEYKDEIEPRILDVEDENRHIVASVKRGGEYGLLHFDLRWYQTTDVYTGFTRKGISIPLEHIDDVIRVLNGIKEECGVKNLL